MKRKVRKKGKPPGIRETIKIGTGLPLHVRARVQAYFCLFLNMKRQDDP